MIGLVATLVYIIGWTAACWVIGTRRDRRHGTWLKRGRNDA